MLEGKLPDPLPRGEFARSDDPDALADARKTAHSLVELSQDYALVYPGLLYELLPLQGQDPIADFTTARGGLQEPRVIHLPEWLAPGVTTTFQKRLLAISPAEAVDFISWVNSLIFVDRLEQGLAVCRFSQIKVLDWLMLDKHPARKIDIATLFVVDLLIKQMPDVRDGLYSVKQLRSASRLLFPRVTRRPLPPDFLKLHSATFAQDTQHGG